MVESAQRRSRTKRARSFAAWISSFTFCCCCTLPQMPPPAPRPPQNVIAQPAPQPPDPLLVKPAPQQIDARISRANFNRLKEGMTMNEVENILGPGRIVGGAQFGSGFWEKYPANPGRSRIHISFNNGRLSTKFFISTEE